MSCTIFGPIASAGSKELDILCASYEGREPVVFATCQASGTAGSSAGGNQANPRSNRGSSEVKQGKLQEWPHIHRHHPSPGTAHQVVVYHLADRSEQRALGSPCAR